MPKVATTFEFKTKLSTAKGNFISTVIYLPPAVVKALPKGRVRTKGTLNGVPFALAPMYKKDGMRYFTVSGPLRRTAKIEAGDPVHVKFRLVDPDVIEIPEELEAVLAQDDEALEVWNTFTTGMQRSLIHYITSVKNVDSRIKRSLELMQKAKTRTLSAQKNKTKG